MTRYRCLKGCGSTNPKAEGKWHDHTYECPKEADFKADWRAFNKAKKNPPPAPAPPAAGYTVSAVVTDAPGGGTLVRFNETPATVVKGGASLVRDPVAVDFVVDGPHTLEAWNFGFSAVYFVFCRVDDWMGWKKHMPREQFRVSGTGQMTIELQPRNLYSATVTWACKTARAKNAAQAHTMITTVVFFGTFGALFVLVFEHYKEAWNESPKMKARRAAKAAAKNARPRMLRALPDGPRPEAAEVAA